jgi:microcystin-dependent protein
MGSPYLSEIKIVSFNYAPRGWALCDGQLLAINQNQALFSLLGTTYGGDGKTNFALPNLQGCVPLHEGKDQFGNTYIVGQAGGQAAVTLAAGQMAAHTHQVQADSAVASSGTPAAEIWADSASNPYSTSANSLMKPSSVMAQGGGQPHNNMPPYLVLNFVIALTGIYPSRN